MPAAESGRSLNTIFRRVGFFQIPPTGPDWWTRDPAEVIDISLRRCQQIFGREIR